MDRIIDSVASGIGGTIGAAAESGVLFVGFAVLWLAFGVALVIGQGGIGAAWSWVTSLPLLVQLLAWVLFLPVMAGMWIWETSWPFAVRVLLVLGLAGWNLLILLPRAVTARP